MKSLRSHVRELQLLENKAAEKAGMRFLISMDERKLLGNKGRSFIRKYIETLSMDIAPEILQAAKMGRELNEEVIGT